MNLGSLIKKKSWRTIMDTTQPGGDNWDRYRKTKTGGCLKSCPGWGKCRNSGPDKTICSEDWKNSIASYENKNILFHIYNNFDRYNQNDLPQYNKDSEKIKELRLFLFNEKEHQVDSEKSFSNIEEDEVGLEKEDLKKIKKHKKVERNQKLIRKVKKFHGYVCQACEFDFSKEYGSIGENYIEAHHLTPISTLKGTVVELNPKLDFGVLCSNCHRMIHRTFDVGNIDEFKKKYLIKR